ncbi:MAG: phenylalanine--tRNA ligase subunit beta, partial [Dehalococcoidia bacterium]
AVEALLAGLDLEGEFTATKDPLFHPGRTAEVRVAGQRVGVVGEVLTHFCEAFDIAGGEVALFELDLQGLLPLLPQQSQRFEPLARFPGSYRDIALLVDTDVPAARLEAIIRRHSLVENVTVFDVYAGTGVPDGKCSLAFRIHFQSPRQTLTAQAINAVQDQVLRDLEQETGARLRG